MAASASLKLLGLALGASLGLGCQTANSAGGSNAPGAGRPGLGAAPSASVGLPPAPAPGPVGAAPWRMHAGVSHGYGCGGHCSFNFSGDSDVAIVLAPDGAASVTDAGWFERSESYPDAHVDARRTWSFAWAGRWSGGSQHRSLRLRSQEAQCATTERGSRTSGPSPCAAAPAEMVLECAWEPPPREERARPPDPNAPALSVAWVCRAPTPPSLELGTELPWVFSPTSAVERSTVGEPFPETSYAPAAAKAPTPTTP